MHIQTHKQAPCQVHDCPPAFVALQPCSQPSMKCTYLFIGPDSVQIRGMKRRTEQRSTEAHAEMKRVDFLLHYSGQSQSCRRRRWAVTPAPSGRNAPARRPRISSSPAGVAHPWQAASPWTRLEINRVDLQQVTEQIKKDRAARRQFDSDCRYTLIQKVKLGQY